MDKSPVKLLVLTTCLQCKALKDMLTEKGVSFESTDVDLLFKDERDRIFADMKAYNKKRSFPVTFIGEEVIVGYQRSLIMETLGLT